ncbi:MAG: HAD family hydrolase [archaeon GBS-70-058]|nr:HAD family hydrolase [Candidatus Culexarchaeum nevadense]
MNFRGVLFDLDGTLIRYSVDRVNLTRDILKSLRKFNIYFQIYSEADYPISMVRKTIRVLEGMKVPKWFIDNVSSTLFRIIEFYEVEASNRTSLIEGAYEALSFVKSIGFKCGLITLNSRRSTEIVLDKFNLKNFFDAIVTRNDVKNFKPHVEHLVKAISLMELNPTEVIVVGDSIIDIIPALALNAFPVAVKTGVRSEDELRSAGAKIVLNSIAEFPGWLQKFLYN